MSWSSNNGDDSPWGKNSKDNSKSSYNGSGRKNNNDDFFDNFQDRLKNLFPKFVDFQMVRLCGSFRKGWYFCLYHFSFQLGEFVFYRLMVFYSSYFCEWFFC